MVETRLKKARNTNTLLSDLLDFFVQVYGTHINTHTSLPSVSVYGTGENIDVLRKDSHSQARLNCCQCLGYPNVGFTKTTDILSYCFASGSNGDQFTAQFRIEPGKADPTLLNKIVKETNIELFLELYNSGYLTPMMGNPTTVYAKTTWAMAFDFASSSMKVADHTEFLKILKFWEEKFGKDFGFSYESKSSTLCNMVFDSVKLPKGKLRMASVELGRIPFSSESICSTLYYFLETKYGIVFEDALMGYWFCTMFLHQSGIGSQYLGNFSFNTNSPYYGNICSFSL